MVKTATDLIHGTWKRFS